MPPYEPYMTPELDDVLVSRELVEKHRDAFAEFVEWELSELNFRADFGALDRRLHSTVSPDDATDRDILRSNVWGDDLPGFSLPDRDSCDVWSHRLPAATRQLALHGLIRILRDWPGCPVKLKEADFKGPARHHILDETYSTAITFYITKFIEIFNRFPSAPGGFPETFSSVWDTIKDEQKM